MSADDPNANRPGYKETKVGWIPEEWEAQQASSLTDRITVGVVIQPTNYYAKSGIRAFRSANVREGHVNDQKWVYFSPAGHRELSKSAVYEGDLLIVRSGVGAGTCCVVPAEFDDSNCIDLVIVSPDSSKLDSNFLCNFVNSDAGRGHVFAKQNGLAQKHFNIGDCQNMWCVVPALPEQKKIAEILETCDEAIEKARALIKAKKRQRSALMQQLLTGRKRLPGFAKTDEKSETRTGEIPADWKSVPLANVFEKRVERSGDELPLMAVTIESGLVSRDSVERKVDSELSASDNLVARRGDIAYNTMRMWQGAVGVAEQDCHVSPAYVVSSPRDGLADSKFFYYWFKSAEGLHLLWSYSYGITGDRLRLYADDFAKVPAPLPPLEEQRAIVSVIETAEDEIASLRQKQGALLRQRKALMQKLLTGQVRVTV